MTAGPIGISDKHLRALGWLAVQAGQLELLVFHFTICKAGLSQEIGNILMGRDNFDAMLSRFGRLVTAADDVDMTTKAQVKDWIKRARSAMLRRNDLVHSVWATPELSDGVFLRAFRSREATDGIPSEQTSTLIVEELAIEIGALCGALMSMSETLGVLA